MTPYEAWNEKKPHIGHIKVFGCVGHMKIPREHTKKLDDRSKQVNNLGKDPGTKTYRLYDPLTKRVHVSRDVTFEEDKSWHWDQASEGEENNIFKVEGMFTSDEIEYHVGDSEENSSDMSGASTPLSNSSHTGDHSSTA